MNNPFRRWHILEGKEISVAAADAGPEAKERAQFVCTGHKDERQINKAQEQLDDSNGKWTWVEVRRKREWRWPWQPKIKVTRMGEGGTVILSEGNFSMNNVCTGDSKYGITIQGATRINIIDKSG